VTTIDADASDAGSVTVMVDVPAAMPVTVPPATVATAGLEEVHIRFGGVATAKLVMTFAAFTTRRAVPPVEIEVVPAG
jgi:hypothetical protein